MSEYFTEYAYRNGYKAGFEAAKQTYSEGNCFFAKFPCKPGDVVYLIVGEDLVTCKCTGFWVAENWIQVQLLDGRTFTCWDGVESYLNKTLFVDKELAVKELERIRNAH